MMTPEEYFKIAMMDTKLDLSICRARGGEYDALEVWLVLEIERFAITERPIRHTAALVIWPGRTWGELNIRHVPEFPVIEAEYRQTNEGKLNMINLSGRPGDFANEIFRRQWSSNMVAGVRKVREQLEGPR